MLDITFSFCFACFGGHWNEWDCMDYEDEDSENDDYKDCGGDHHDIITIVQTFTSGANDFPYNVKWDFFFSWKKGTFGF